MIVGIVASLFLSFCMRVVLTSEQIAAYSTIEEVNKPVQMRSSAQFRKQQALHPVPAFLLNLRILHGINFNLYPNNICILHNMR